MTYGKRAVVGLGLAIVLAVGGLGGSAANAATTTGKCWSNPSKTCQPVMAQSWTVTQLGQTHWTIGKNRAVRMICWTTGKSALGSAKWFKVKTASGYPIIQGLVPAPAVKNQVIVGRC